MLDLQIVNDITEQIKSFRDSLRINEHALQSECADQPVLIADVGELKAKTCSLCDNAKNALKIVDAEVESDIRNNPEAHGVVKVTESSIASAVVLNARHREAMADYIDASELSNMVMSLYDAVAGRRSGIRDLVTLFVSKYYSEVDAPTKNLVIETRRENIRRLRTEKDD